MPNNMTKPRTKVLKTGPGRKRMDERIKPAAKPPAQPAPAVAPPEVRVVDIERFSRNMARMVEEGGKALAAYLKPREQGEVKIEPSEEIADVVKTFGQVAEYW